MNEKIFIINIELNSLVAIKKFENILSKMGNHKKIIENVYAIKVAHTNTSEIIRNQIKSELSGLYPLFIMKSSTDAAWQLPFEVDGWIKNNI